MDSHEIRESNDMISTQKSWNTGVKALGMNELPAVPFSNVNQLLHDPTLRLISEYWQGLITRFLLVVRISKSLSSLSFGKENSNSKTYLSISFCDLHTYVHFQYLVYCKHVIWFTTFCQRMAKDACFSASTITVQSVLTDFKSEKCSLTNCLCWWDSLIGAVE